MLHGADTPVTASGSRGNAAAGSDSRAAWEHPPTVSLKDVMVIDTRGQKLSSLDGDELPMAAVCLDQLSEGCWF